MIPPEVQVVLTYLALGAVLWFLSRRILLAVKGRGGGCGKCGTMKRRP